MKKSPAKERMLGEELTLFSEKCYKAVTVSRLIQAVDIKAKSLYKLCAIKRAY